MKKFTNDEEKFEFLKKYRLMAKTLTELPIYYYYRSENSVPEPCEIIGQDGEYESWAVVIIAVKGKAINIHSDHLKDMKERGTKYYKNHTAVEDTVSYVVYDLETTGLNHKRNEIIEIGALKISAAGITEFAELVKPDGIIPIDITAKTGISNEMVYEARPISEVLPDFLEFIGDARLVGHNIASFDNHFLNDACEKCGYPPIHNAFVDTLQLAREKLPALSHYKISDLCEYYDIDNSGAHRALADCYMCNEIYTRLLSDNTDSSFISSPKKRDTRLSYCNIELNPINPPKDDAWVQTSDNPFLQQVIDSLNQICMDKELLPGSLRLIINEGEKTQNYSIHAYEYAFPIGSYKNVSKSFLKIAISKNNITLEVQKRVYSALPQHPEYTKYSERESKATGNIMSIIAFEAPTIELHKYICDIVLYRLARYRTGQPSFGCCNKHNECSDALKCVHENKLYSTACSYRHRLENGEVFYGKNRNVD